MRKLLPVIFIVVSAAALLLFIVTNNNKDESDGSDSNNESNNRSNNNASNYSSGTYSESITYDSPGGPDNMTVELTISDNKVTAVNIVEDAGNPKSATYQADFSAAIGGEIIGKEVNDINISTIAGASLTTDAFNEALAEIKAQAGN